MQAKSALLDFTFCIFISQKRSKRSKNEIRTYESEGDRRFKPGGCDMRNAVVKTRRNMMTRNMSKNITRNTARVYGVSKKPYKKKNRKKIVKARRRILLKLLILVPLVILIAMLFFGTNVAGQDDIRETKNDYYHELEGRYMEVLKAELTRKGMGSAGITMTSIIDIKGDRTYKVQLHHEKIGKMDDEARESFLEYMATIDFADGETPVVYSIL